jgi:hypothetical protein
MKGVELNNECEEVITKFWTNATNDTRVTFTSKKVKRLVNVFFLQVVSVHSGRILVSVS